MVTYSTLYIGECERFNQSNYKAVLDEVKRGSNVVIFIISMIVWMA